jgi:hypothetical protein
VRLVDHGDTGISPLSSLEGVEHGAVVGAVTRGLNEDGAREL